MRVSGSLLLREVGRFSEVVAEVEKEEVVERFL